MCKNFKHSVHDLEIVKMSINMELVVSYKHTAENYTTIEKHSVEGIFQWKIFLSKLLGKKVYTPTWLQWFSLGGKINVIFSPLFYVNLKFRKHDVLLYSFSRNLVQKYSKCVIVKTWSGHLLVLYDGSGYLCLPTIMCYLPGKNHLLPYSCSVPRTAGNFRWRQFPCNARVDLGLNHQSIPSLAKMLCHE